MYEAVFEHLSALFRRSHPTISVSYSTTDFEKLIKVPGITHTGLFGDTVDAKMLDEHFEEYPNQTSVFIDAQINGQFSEDSAFLKVSTIFSETSSPISLFKLFKGRELRLCNYKFHTNDVIDFLEKWISGDSHQNLEHLYLYSHVSLNIDRRAIIERFGLARWPENSPYIFEFKTRMDRSKENDRLVYDCRRCYQVQQANDHKLAALQVDVNYIRFFVFQ
ncbi:unnamed protein product [Caenorhabditis brenneri]